MSKLGRARAARLALLLCASLTAISLSFGVSGAEAASLEGATGTVDETVGGTVEKALEAEEEVTNPVTPPVEEVVEPAPPPVEEVTEAVVPPVKKAAESAVQTTKEATRNVPPPVAASTPKAPKAPEAARSVSGAAKSGTDTVGEALGGATRSARSSTGGRTAGSPNADAVAAPGAVPHPEAARSTSNAKVPEGGGGMRGVDRFTAPTTDGAVRAPLPKWAAYVWPAIALPWPEPAHLLQRFGPNKIRLLLAIATAAAPTATAQTGSDGIAAAHSSHGARAGAPDHSSPPLMDIPSVFGGVISREPEEVLAYFVIVALLVAAVFAVVRYEIARSNRAR